MLPGTSPLALVDEEVPDLAHAAIKHYLSSAHLLGQRTAEMHLALSAGVTDVAFAPNLQWHVSALGVSDVRSQAGRVFQSLRNVLATLPDEARADAEHVARLENKVLACFQQIIRLKISAMRTRCHGDFHLGQVLYTGNDFMIIDFEGEPARSLSERRRKRSPLIDVAGMLRSFHYAAHTALFKEIEAGIIHAEHVAMMQHWAHYWYMWVSATFLKSYLATSSQTVFIPQTREETQVMLNAYLIDKAVYELGYELNNRPSWARIPLWGILQLLDEQSTSAG
ncbi:MAG: phosphotransferase [Chloroflexaceae bacterium]|nr:phosphotransferase [Chloroflexaceae bacterium]